jgi:hypothetical protein
LDEIDGIGGKVRLLRLSLVEACCSIGSSLRSTEPKKKKYGQGKIRLDSSVKERNRADREVRRKEKPT